MTTNKPEVKRYDPFGYDGMSALMHEDDLGDWVRLEDYEALQAECEKLRKDAERYGWLCEFREWPVEVDTAIDCGHKALIDAAIDAARLKEREK